MDYGQTSAILESIRMNASTEYQTIVPDATQTSITTVGNAIMDSGYSFLKNEFISTLFEQIGMTIIKQKTFNNKLSKYKKGMVSPNDINEIFMDMANNAVAYDKTGATTLARKTPMEVQSTFHRRNRADTYECTVGDIDLRRAFTSEAMFKSFLERTITAIYSKANYDEWVIMKKLLADYKTEYASYSVTAITTEATAKKFMTTLKKAVADISFPTRKFNKAGVMNWTDEKELVLLIQKDIISYIDVEVLTGMFNLDKALPTVTIEIMDDFADMGNTYAILMDKDMFMIFDTLTQFEPQRNAQGMFTNYFLNIQQILSLSPFCNAIRFTTETTFSVVFDANGGTVASGSDLYYTRLGVEGTKVSLPLGTDLTKTGKTFSGWALTNDAVSGLAGGVYTVSDSDDTSGVITLYAVWK